MKTTPLPIDALQQSVAVVPPLAWRAEGEFDSTANTQIVRHIEAGGVKILMYGGNANFYHIAGPLYARAVAMVAELAGPHVWVIPSAGPAFGTLDQSADILREHSFPTAMLLPSDVSAPDGVMRTATRFAERLGRAVVIYVRRPNYVTPDDVARLIRDGAVAFVKYGVVAPDPAADEYLTALVDGIGADRIVSGSGEIVAGRHFSRFPLLGFTSGSAVLAPSLSMRLREALGRGDEPSVRNLIDSFRPFEAQRDATHPIIALHEAVALAGIAETGPILPPLTALAAGLRAGVAEAASILLGLEMSARSAQTPRAAAAS
jgi:dihydrodipicolinate synthase/N-acetylneuraminate lyase